MKKFNQVILAAMLLSSLFFAGPAQNVAAKEFKLMEFDTMVGLPAGLTSAQSQVPLRGINGGGLPWALTSASGELSSGGHLELKVRGLVLAAGANTGSNPIANFRVLVSCVTDTGSVQNVLSDPFPATTGPAISGGGNAKIETDLTLPQPCIAPIVFVTSPGGAWFAATGS